MELMQILINYNELMDQRRELLNNVVAYTEGHWDELDNDDKWILQQIEEDLDD